MIFAHITLPLSCVLLQSCSFALNQMSGLLIMLYGKERIQKSSKYLMKLYVLIVWQYYSVYLFIYEKYLNRLIEKHYFVISYAFYVSIYPLIDHCLVGLLWSAVLYYVMLFAATKWNVMKKGFGFVPLKICCPTLLLQFMNFINFRVCLRR